VKVLLNYSFKRGNQIMTHSDIKSLSVDEKIRLLTDINAPPTEVLIQLATDEDPDVRYYVAARENTPPEILEILSSDEDECVRWEVARNYNTPIKILELLATTDKDYWNRYQAQRLLLNNLSNDEKVKLASDPNTSQEILKVLAIDPKWYIRYRVAKNLKTSDETQVILATDDDFSIRFTLAKHPHLSQKAIIILVNDGDLLVRERVAMHPNNSQETLRKLANDKDSWIRRNAKMHPNYKISRWNFFKFLFW